LLQSGHETVAVQNLIKLCADMNFRQAVPLTS